MGNFIDWIWSFSSSVLKNFSVGISLVLIERFNDPTRGGLDDKWSSLENAALINNQ
jgi:hypothetical protein